VDVHWEGAIAFLIWEPSSVQPRPVRAANSKAHASKRTLMIDKAVEVLSRYDRGAPDFDATAPCRDHVAGFMMGYRLTPRLAQRGLFELQGRPLLVNSAPVDYQSRDIQSASIQIAVAKAATNAATPPNRIEAIMANLSKACAN
jgi:hypothetical protein